MKIKRQKKVQRILDFYKHNFGHFPPYQILLDGTFAMACLKMQINIKEQMPKYIGQEVKILRKWNKFGLQIEKQNYVVKKLKCQVSLDRSAFSVYILEFYTYE